MMMATVRWCYCDDDGDGVIIIMMMMMANGWCDDVVSVMLYMCDVISV